MKFKTKRLRKYPEQPETFGKPILLVAGLVTFLGHGAVVIWLWRWLPEPAIISTKPLEVFFLPAPETENADIGPPPPAINKNASLPKPSPHLLAPASAGATSPAAAPPASLLDAGRPLAEQIQDFARRQSFLPESDEIPSSPRKQFSAEQLRFKPPISPKRVVTAIGRLFGNHDPCLDIARRLADARTPEEAQSELEKASANRCRR